MYVYVCTKEYVLVCINLWFCVRMHTCLQQNTFLIPAIVFPFNCHCREFLDLVDICSRMIEMFILAFVQIRRSPLFVANIIICYWYLLNNVEQIEFGTFYRTFEHFHIYFFSRTHWLLKIAPNTLKESRCEKLERERRNESAKKLS